MTSQGESFAGGSGNVTVGLSYNPAAQIVEQTRDNADYAYTGQYAISRAYVPNGLNQYARVGQNATPDRACPASDDGCRTYRYDPNGNLIGDGARTYVYDGENRLVLADTAAGTDPVRLVYDPLGRLSELSSRFGTRRFLYEGDQLVAEYDGDTLAEAYVHGPGEDDPLLWYHGSEGARWYRRDHQGSVVAVSDASGYRVAVNRYDDHGIPDALNTGRFQYTGQAWLGEIGLYHYKARVYSPNLGRFLQTDPIGYDDQVNLYAYVGNDPVNGRDPDGKQTVMGPVYDGLDRATAACGGDAQCGLKAWNQIQQGVAENVAIVAATELSGAAIIRGAGWAARSYSKSRAAAAMTESKVFNYLLNPATKDGASKAAWFDRALGFTKKMAGT